MDLVIWIFGVLILLISALAGIVWKAQQKRLAVLDQSMKILLESSNLMSHLSMDKARETSWLDWRSQVEKRFDNHALRIEKNENGISRIEGRMNGQRQ